MKDFKQLIKKSSIQADKQQVFVPEVQTHFIPLKETYYTLKGLEVGHVYIHGETGLGKTQSVFYLANQLGKNLREINMCGEVTPDQFVGYLSVKDKSIFFQKGLLLDCMEKGYWLLIDEIDYASPAVLSVLNNVLQYGRYTIPETKEIIEAQPGFRLIATGNTTGGGDDSGFYQGTHFLNKALLYQIMTIIL